MSAGDRLDQLLAGEDEACALVLEDGRRITYGELREGVHEIAAGIPEGSLIFCFGRSGLDVILAFLAALAAAGVVAVLDTLAPKHRRLDLVDQYQPEFIVLPPASDIAPDARDRGYADVAPRPLADTVMLRRDEGVPPARPGGGLSLLLSTSGSTGSPKFVRLAARNIVANAQAIATALRLDGDDCGATLLPLCYSYGLSVVTSHLAAGARVAVVSGGLGARPALRACSAAGVTTISGVPGSYRLLVATGAARWLPGTTRRLCTSGARFPPSLVPACVGEARRLGSDFYSMYGQTEATSRISVLPPEAVVDRPASVGVPVGDGRVVIDAPDDEGIGEIVFSGSSAMLGYAVTRQDLSLGDRQGGTVRTGDLGTLDDDGFLSVMGRRHRIAKLAGLRVVLDELEQLLEPDGDVAVVEDQQQERLDVFVEEGANVDVLLVRDRLRNLLPAVPPEHFRIIGVGQLPRTTNGKVAYGLLAPASGPSVEAPR